MSMNADYCLALVGNIYWKRVLIKETIDAICFWCDNWMNNSTHPIAYLPNPLLHY
jgi:hypothetical protein